MEILLSSKVIGNSPYILVYDKEEKPPISIELLALDTSS